MPFLPVYFHREIKKKPQTAVSESIRNIICLTSSANAEIYDALMHDSAKFMALVLRQIEYRSVLAHTKNKSAKE